MAHCVIVNYGSGNVRSVFRALEHVSTEHKITLSDDPKIIAQADHLVLPGVGAFTHCAASLQGRSGVSEAIHEHAITHQRPFLGICVGMQLLASRGEEFDGHNGLNWISGTVQPFAENSALCVPHMGWSPICPTRDHPVTADLADSGMMYFVHSFVFRAANPDHVLATAHYGEEFTAIIGKDNIIGTQFHPEKSQQMGLRLLDNFLQWRP